MATKKKKIKAYYFGTTDNRLRHGDSREIVVGETHEVDGTPELCRNGLHASKDILDALKYAPGPILYEVELSGDMDIGGDKIAAQRRKYVSRVDLSSVLPRFARLCALDVVDLWNAPKDVIHFLKHGEGDPVTARDASAAASAAYAYAYAADAGADTYAAATAAASAASAAAAYAYAAIAAASAASAADAYASADDASDAAAYRLKQKQRRRLLQMVARERKKIVAW